MLFLMKRYDIILLIYLIGVLVGGIILKTKRINIIKKCAAAMMAASVLISSGAVTPVQAQAAVKWSQLRENDDLYPGAKSAEDSNRYVYILPRNATTKKGCKVVAYFGESQKIKLPSKIGDYKVTNLGKAFSTLTSIQTMTIPSGYTTIETEAFAGLGQVYRVVIPASGNNIAVDAF